MCNVDSLNSKTPTRFWCWQKDSEAPQKIPPPDRQKRSPGLVTFTTRWLVPSLKLAWHLKIDGWNTIISFWDGLSSCVNCLVSGSAVVQFWWHLTGSWWFPPSVLTRTQVVVQNLIFSWLLVQNLIISWLLMATLVTGDVVSRNPPKPRQERGFPMGV